MRRPCRMPESNPASAVLGRSGTHPSTSMMRNRWAECAAPASHVKLERLDSGDLEMWAFPRAKDRMGTAGALVRIPGVASGGNSTLVYFSCEDCAVEAARVAGAGGKLHRDKLSIGQYGFVALALDTEGNTFGMHSLR